MFSALGSRGAVENARVLDLFSGTGALAFEALSRGAKSAVCVDRDRKCVSAIRQGAEALSLKDDLTELAIDLLGSPRVVVDRLGDQGPFDLILADPPYAEIGGAVSLLETLAEAGFLADDALVVLEHASRDALDLGPRLASVASYRYGDTAVAFLTAAEQSSR